MRLLLPPVLLVIAIAVMLLLHRYQPLALLIPPPWHWLGLLPLAGGLAIASWHARLFRRKGTNIKTFDAPGQLVTEGLFRVSRNPIYLGFVIALAGVAGLLGSASPLLVVLAYFVITDRWYIAYEEQMMAAAFGEQYRNYQRRVRRWI